MRKCGDCTRCCDGTLVGSTRGAYFGNGIPCKYLIDSKCSIYVERPSQCSDYQCAWTQWLLPDWCSPARTGAVVSVEIDENNRRFLKAVVCGELLPSVEDELTEFCNTNRTYFVIVKVIPIVETR